MPLKHADDTQRQPYTLRLFQIRPPEGHGDHSGGQVHLPPLPDVRRPRQGQDGGPWIARRRRCFEHRRRHARDGREDEKHQDGTWTAEGVGIGDLKSPAEPMEMGNSGTSTRLLAGLVAGQSVTATFIGDASLSKRPMGRIITPLESMGASFKSTDGKLPMTVTGTANVKSIHYKLPVASAQVKSAILLAGLRGDGVTTVIKEKPTRDHTENMLRHYGVKVDVEDLENGAQAIHLKGGQTMTASTDIHVPRDPSSAASLLLLR